MANFLDTSADVDQRLGEFSARVFRVEAHLRRGERRAARAQLDGFLEEIDAFSREMELPLETIIVGAQLGFFSGGSLLRGRIPGAMIGAAAGWLYGQHSLQNHRLFLEEILTRVEELYRELFIAEQAELDRRIHEATES